MKRLILPVSLLFAMLVSAPAIAGDFDWKKELERDLVTVEDGTMKYSEKQLCTFPRDGKKIGMLITWKASAPAKGVLSRDQFVANVSKLSMVIILGMMLPDKGEFSSVTGKLNCVPADSAAKKDIPATTVPVSAATHFNEKGIDVVLKFEDEKATKKTLPWQDFFGRK